jgi:2'-5' RNA ligase
LFKERQSTTSSLWVLVLGGIAKANNSRSEMESTLAILVPETEGLIRSFRDRYDPAAKAGMPAHITLIYPFKFPNEIDGLVLDTLSYYFSHFQPFKFSLRTVNQFPGETLYLVPEPGDPFRALTLGIWRCYPDTPPYRGRYSTVVPHLTVADRMGEQRLAEVAREFEQAAQRCLPIQAQAAEVTLMDTRSGRWEINTTFRLGQGS